MIIGIPRERKILEKRVGLTPAGAKELTKRGHTVLIEKDAGLASWHKDEDYIAAGCEIQSTLKEVWTKSELIVKVKEPHEEEFQFFREDLTVFDYLHLAGLPKVAKALLEKKVTGIAFELVTNEAGKFPLLEPMSIVAGKLSVLNGTYRLLSQHGGRGLLASGLNSVAPAHIVIVGGGVAGKAACEMAVGMCARVSVLDINKTVLKDLKNQFTDKIETILSEKKTLSESVKKADILIGAVLVPGAKAPQVITKEMVNTMKEGSVIVDISIDQGGCVETSKTTSLEEPTFKYNNVIHYAVPNMPAQTARTSTQALMDTTLPFIIEIADKGVEKSLSENSYLRNALCTHIGNLTNEAISQSLGIEYKRYSHQH